MEDIVEALERKYGLSVPQGWSHAAKQSRQHQEEAREERSNDNPGELTKAKHQGLERGQIKRRSISRVRSLVADHKWAESSLDCTSNDLQTLSAEDEKLSSSGEDKQLSSELKRLQDFHSPGSKSHGANLQLCNVGNAELEDRVRRVPQRYGTTRSASSENEAKRSAVTY